MLGSNHPSEMAMYSVQKKRCALIATEFDLEECLDICADKILSAMHTFCKQNMELAGRAPEDAVSLIGGLKPGRAMLAFQDHLCAPLYGAGELPDGRRGGIYLVRHPAAGSGVARFNANFHGVYSPTHHDTLYTMVRVNAGNPEPCINHAARAADP